MRTTNLSILNGIIPQLRRETQQQLRIRLRKMHLPSSASSSCSYGPIQVHGGSSKIKSNVCVSCASFVSFVSLIVNCAEPRSVYISADLASATYKYKHKQECLLYSYYKLWAGSVTVWAQVHLTNTTAGDLLRPRWSGILFPFQRSSDRIEIHQAISAPHPMIQDRKSTSKPKNYCRTRSSWNVYPCIRSVFMIKMVYDRDR